VLDPELPAWAPSPALPAPAMTAAPPEPACDALPPFPLGSPVVAALLLHAEAPPVKTKIKLEIAERVRFILATESVQLRGDASAAQADFLEICAMALAQ